MNQTSNEKTNLEEGEPYAGKLARTVLRGRGCGNAALLPDYLLSCDSAEAGRIG